MIGVIVEGIGEIDAVKSYLERVGHKGKIFTRPSYADMQPKANPRVIATAAKTAVNQLLKRGATKIIVLIDLEDRKSPLAFAEELRQAFEKTHPGVSIVPVVKNFCLENWMIADTEALRSMPKRFSNIEKIDRFLNNHHCADKCNDPITLLNECAIRTEYHKTQDPPRIASRQDLNRLATHSGSFRVFLAELNKA